LQWTTPLEKKFIWWGFSSCTVDMQSVKSFLGKEKAKTLFGIHFNRAYDIMPFSLFVHEREVLLPPSV